MRGGFAAPTAARCAGLGCLRGLSITDVAGGSKTNVTAKIRASQKADFVDRDDDHPSDVLGPWGSPTWSKDGAMMYLYTDLDVWEVSPDGSGGKRLTDGAREGIRYRLVALGARLDPFGFGASAAVTVAVVALVGSKYVDLTVLFGS